MKPIETKCSLEDLPWFFPVEVLKKLSSNLQECMDYRDWDSGNSLNIPYLNTLITFLRSTNQETWNEISFDDREIALSDFETDMGTYFKSKVVNYFNSKWVLEYKDAYLWKSDLTGDYRVDIKVLNPEESSYSRGAFQEYLDQWIFFNNTKTIVRCLEQKDGEVCIKLDLIKDNIDRYIKSVQKAVDISGRLHTHNEEAPIQIH